MSDVEKSAEIVIACDLSVFTDAERENHMRDAHNLFAEVTEIYERPDGYALRLPDSEGMLGRIAAFINDDRRCCPFIHFGMEVEPQSKAIWLTLKGNAEVKAAIHEELVSLTPDDIPFNITEV